MAGGDGWWATPLPPSSPTRSLLARTLGGAFGVNGGGEGGLFSAFSLSSTFARGFNPGLAGVVAVKAETNNNAIAGNQGGGASVTSDAEMGFGVGGSSAGDCTRMPPPQQRQKQQSPMRNVKSIAERRAARCGFTAPRINTARFRCSSGSPICSPAAVRSPCLTIPPGLSPTALLDSPVMLMDAQMQPSPTTGTFLLSPRNHEMLAAITLRSHMAEGNSENLDSSFVFKLPQDSVSVQCIQSSENKVSSEPSTEHLGMGNIHSQSVAQVQIQIEYESHAGPLGEILSKSCFIDSQSDMEASDDTVAKAKNTANPGRDPDVINNETQIEKPQNRNDVSQHVQDGEQAGAFPPSSVGRQSEDGFNWRKYGQKQVKGSEYPRGYYKCTHPDCQVKKKVERSYDGQITEIIYKGKHNHLKPQPARRSTIGSSFPGNEIFEITENAGSPMKTESKSVWSTHHGSEEETSVDCQMDGLERMSSTSAVTDLSDPLSTAIEKHSSELDSSSNLELSSTIVCHVDDDDQVTQESMSLEGDDEDDKSDSKRRKNENYMVEANSVSRAVREPRVVVQTESEVDILDDGYRWRKYGQKVVKGNPNPRSYYKCTNSGCSVRKHVERAAHDLKSVITTYEGKHNHEVPVARNSSQSSSTGGSFRPASNAPTAKILPGSAINPEHAAIGEDLVHFKRKLDLSNEIANPSYPGSLYGNTKFGASSCYEMKLLQQLAFQTSVPSTDDARLFHTSAIASLSSEFPISLSMTIHRASNAALAAVNGNHGRTAGSAVQSLLLGQQSNESGGRFLKAPKQEQEDVAFSYVLPMDNLTDTSPTECGQIMDGDP